ncbi:MAG: hypothetical protein E3J81_07445 [Dehalococcoidia bacterium]|nr:MAG: hypothetical protein E3J81_07445 [Dehalococcoidia bacterium]
MGLKALIASIWGDKVNVASSVPAIYAAGAQNIFAITGGPVLIAGIIEYLDTALAGATTTTILIGALPMDGGALAIDAGGIGAVVVSPLDSAGVIAKVASALVVPIPSLLGLAAGGVGVVAGPGVNIVWTFGGVAMVAGELVSLHVMYRKLAGASLIA